MKCCVRKIIRASKVNKKLFILILVISLIVPFIAASAEPQTVLENPKMVRPKASDVENMTLIIGTHMIALNALTTELNDVAMATVQDSNQNKIYYKSELSDEKRGEQDNKGAWYEVQNANDLEDILSSGNIVSDAIIDSLILTHYTNKTGQTYDLSSGREVDIFNIDDPYDISKMDELKSLKIEYDARQDGRGDNEDKNEAIEKSLETVFKLDVHSDETDKLDIELDGLKKYNDYLIQNDAGDNERQEISEIRSAINAKRKGLIIEKIIEKIDEESQNNTDVATTLGDAKNELISAKPDIEAKASKLVVSENDSTFNRKEVELVNELRNAVENNNYLHANETLNDILALQDLSATIISNPEIQSKLVNELYLQAKGSYYDLAGNGESDEYKQTKDLNGSVAKLDYLKKQYQDNLNSKKYDLNMLLNLKIKLANNEEEAQALMQAEIDDLAKRMGNISATIDSDLAGNADEFKKIALSNLEGLSDNFNEKIQSIAEQSVAGNGMTAQEEKMLQLSMDYKIALDNNDLAKAKSIKNEINALQSELDKQNQENINRLNELQNQLTDVQKSLSSSDLSGSQRSSLEIQKIALKNSIAKLGASKSSLLSNTMEQVAKKSIDEAQNEANKILSQVAIKEKDVNALRKNIDDIKNIASTQPQIAYNALLDISQNVKSKLENDESLPSSMLNFDVELSLAIDNCEKMLEKDKSSDLDADSINSKIENFVTQNELSDYDGEILALGALSELLNQYGSVEDKISTDEMSKGQVVIKNRMSEILAQILTANKRRSSDLKAVLIDKKLKNSELYAPAETVALLMNMKYIWNVNLVEGYLINKSTQYRFIQGKNIIVSSKSGDKTMSNEALFVQNRSRADSELWLPASFWINEFELTLQNIQTTNKVIVYDENSYGLMKKMLEVFK